MQKNLQHLSYFEFLFAMAAVYFSKLELDYVIYETGLGGRLDATNVLVPVLTIITEIGLDHMKYLGNTIEAIAGEKAGIIKTGVPVVYHTGSLEADAVVKNQAEALAAEAINVANVEYNIDEFTDKTIDFSMYSRYYSYNGLRLDSVATYQVDNAVTAITAGTVLLGRQIAQEKIQLALDAFFWPGRMEKLNGNIVIDGIVFSPAILRWMRTPEEVMNQSVLYLRIYSYGLVFNVIYNMAAGILNAVGNSRRSLMYLAVASFSNIFLDLWLIGGMHMGVEGAAIATDISQVLSCIFALWFLMRVPDIYRINPKKLSIDRTMAGRIIQVGRPTAIQNTVTSFSNVLVQSGVKGVGASAMAGFGAYLKVDGFNILPVMSFSMAATTFTGQNYGAGIFHAAGYGPVVRTGFPAALPYFLPLSYSLWQHL